MLRYGILLCVAAASIAAQLSLDDPSSSLRDTLEQANMCFKAQRLTDAKALAEKALQIAPANPAAFEIIGNVQYLRGEDSAAIGTFIDLLELHPEDQEAPYMLGRIYYQQGSLDQAIGQFQRLLKLNPAAYKAYDNLGLCYSAKGEDEKAIRYLLTAIKMTDKDHPEYDSAYADMAELLLKTGDPQKAFGAASKAADRSPYSARDFYLGAKALEQLGKIDLCLNWAGRSAALDPTYPEPQYLLARVYRRLGQLDKAEATEKKFADLKLKNPSRRR